MWESLNGGQDPTDDPGEDDQGDQADAADAATRR
jgi:hypothetical protein